MSNERIDIESMEARMRLWGIGDISDEDLALELDYIVPELKRCYEQLDKVKAMLEDNGLWVSQEGWEESDKDDELLVSMNYLIQALQETSE